MCILLSVGSGSGQNNDVLFDIIILIKLNQSTFLQLVELKR